MFDICPLIKKECAFCGLSKGEYFCGASHKKKKDKGIETRISMMGKCPQGKDSKSADILKSTSAIITDKTIGDNNA